MAIFRPFKAIRPIKGKAESVSSLPYDVMNRQEAKEMAKGNSESFLHIVRSEIDLDDSISQYDEKVYKKAKLNLDEFIKKGILLKDSQECFYIYRLIRNGKSQTGLVGCASVDDYQNDVIKKHELTRPAKEEDRINNFYYCDANTEPIFLARRKNIRATQLMNNWIDNNDSIYDFTSEDDVRHIVWVVDDKDIITELVNIYSEIEYLYIADGHHRTASSIKVAIKKRNEKGSYTTDEEFNFFLSVVFEDDDLEILDYNRVVKDLNGLNINQFLDKVSVDFEVREYVEEGAYRPAKKHEFGMFLDSKWYVLTAKKGCYETGGVIGSLDAQILQEKLLNPILGIDDPRTNERIEFIGGIRGLKELEKRVSEDMQVAFSMYPTSMEDLFEVADTNLTMPPKSTWFEPKLRSGLFIHDFS